MKIIEQIQDVPKNHGTIQIGYPTESGVGLWAEDGWSLTELRELVASREELIRAARQWVKEYRIEYDPAIDNDPDFEALAAAVERCDSC